MIRPAILCLWVLAAVFSQVLPVTAPQAMAKAESGASKIVWSNNYSQTLKSAGAKKKWVLVDVYTDWCHWCKKLDADVYDEPKAAKFINASFVCMKANAEQGDGQMVAQKFGVRGFPCTLVLAPDGKLKGQIGGYHAPGEFCQMLSDIVKGK